MDKKAAAAADLSAIMASAKRLGVELDEEEALQWLTAMAAQKPSSDIVVDEEDRGFWAQGDYAGFQPGTVGTLPGGRKNRGI